MGTKHYNYIDKLVSLYKLFVVRKYFESNDTVLDFGCGHQAYLIRSLQGKVRYGVGLDYDVDNYQNKSMRLIKYRFTGKLPYKKESFDKVVTLAVIEHMKPDMVRKLLKEVRRVLRKDGLLILTTPTPFSRPILEFMAFRLGIISKIEIRDHKKYYGYTDMQQLAAKTGFSMVDYHTFQLGINSLYILKKTG